MRLRLPKAKDISRGLTFRANPLKMFDPLLGTTPKAEPHTPPPASEDPANTRQQELDTREVNLRAIRRRRRRGTGGTLLSTGGQESKTTLGSAGR